jgi:uncharacterized protein YndB with AHSA1/START domain
MTSGAAPTKSIVVERDLPHPPEKVWRALTQSALVAEWLMPNDFELKECQAARICAWSIPASVRKTKAAMRP